MDHLCYICPVLVMLLCLFIAALWPPAGKGMISWLSFVIIPVFFFRKKKCILISYQCRSVVRLSDCPSVRPSVRHVSLDVSPPKPLDLASSNFIPR